MVEKRDGGEPTNDAIYESEDDDFYEIGGWTNLISLLFASLPLPQACITLFKTQLHEAGLVRAFYYLYTYHQNQKSSSYDLSLSLLCQSLNDHNDRLVRVILLQVIFQRSKGRI